MWSHGPELAHRKASTLRDMYTSTEITTAVQTHRSRPVGAPFGYQLSLRRWTCHLFVMQARLLASFTIGGSRQRMIVPCTLHIPHG